MKRAAVLIVALFLGAGSLLAVGADVRFDDPEKQQRYEHLINELRCLVCQNQTIADSNADLAMDLRQKVFEQIEAGRTDAQIIEYLTARYGDFVLYRPPVQANTWLLWAGPFLLLALGALVLVFTLRGRAALVSDDDEENAS